MALSKIPGCQHRIEVLFAGHIEEAAHFIEDERTGLPALADLFEIFVGQSGLFGELLVGVGGHRHRFKKTVVNPDFDAWHAKPQNGYFLRFNKAV